MFCVHAVVKHRIKWVYQNVTKIIYQQNRITVERIMICSTRFVSRLTDAWCHFCTKNANKQIDSNCPRSLVKTQGGTKSAGQESGFTAKSIRAWTMEHWSRLVFYIQLSSIVTTVPENNIIRYEWWISRLVSHIARPIKARCNLRSPGL